MTVLLHTCCGPCASACVPRLAADGHEVMMLFANSNIDTREEFEKRKAEAEKLAKHDGVRFVALPYDHAEWLREVAAGYENEPEKGKRCARCFRYNLAKTAAFAREHGIESFTTSLTVSPHKVSSMIFSAANDLSTPQPRNLATSQPRNLSTPQPRNPATSQLRNPATFLPYDFKKREGFKLSVKRAEELGLYRQSYCGCEFSKRKID